MGYFIEDGVVYHDLLGSGWKTPAEAWEARVKYLRRKKDEYTSRLQCAQAAWSTALRDESLRPPEFIPPEGACQDVVDRLDSLYRDYRTNDKFSLEYFIQYGAFIIKQEEARLEEEKEESQG